jgi:hypothetical protein
VAHVLPEEYLERQRKLNFLCPNCNRECDHVMGEIIFPEFKEALPYAFRLCWKCEMVRPCKPFGWKPKKQGLEYPVRWRTFKEARKAMWIKQSSADEPINLSNEAMQRALDNRYQKFRRHEKARGAGGYQRFNKGRLGGPRG